LIRKIAAITRKIKRNCFKEEIIFMLGKKKNTRPDMYPSKFLLPMNTVACSDYSF